MLVGYAGVSNADGSKLLYLQRDALVDAGVATEGIYEDGACGRKDHRPGLETCLKTAQPGNTFVVWKRDTDWGRDLKHLGVCAVGIWTDNGRREICGGSDADDVSPVRA